MKFGRMAMAETVAAMAAMAAMAAAGGGKDAVADLAGTWRAKGGSPAVEGEVRLPGTLADAKLGRHVAMDDWRKDRDRRVKGALTREWQTLGEVRYERDFELTPGQAAKPLELVVERTMGLSKAYWDGKALGSCDSLGTEHVYAIPEELATPGRHKIALAIDNSNRYNFSRWSHGYGPVMQSVWHGAIGAIELRRRSPLRGVRVFAPAPGAGDLELEVPESFRADISTVSLEPWTGENGPGGGTECRAVPAPCRVKGVKSVRPSPFRPGFNLVSLELDGTPSAWSCLHPALYTLRLRDAGDGFEHAIRFGFRTIEARDRRLWINGERWFMRATLDNCHFPKSGSPEMGKAWWKKTFAALRDEDGVNSIRFHSWTPPRAAFEAADEEGLALAVETAVWIDTWMKDGKFDFPGFGKPIDGFVQRELRAVQLAYGNSPSFFSLAIGNELGGANYKELTKWIAACKAFDPRRLYFASTARYDWNGKPQRACGADDYYSAAGVQNRRHRFEPRTDWDYDSVFAGERLPFVAHEIGQWPIYVDWDRELAQYTGVLRPYNLMALRDRAEKAGTRRLWETYALASAKLNRLMYKEEAESWIRTPSCCGLQLLGVQDFTGQGEAMVGWRDSSYNIKNAARGLPPFNIIFNKMPHLARFHKFIWIEGETFKADLQVRNLGEEALAAGTRMRWDFAGSSGEVALPCEVRAGELSPAMPIAVPLKPGEAAGTHGRRHVLRFGTNSWPLWVFPAAQNGGAAPGAGTAEKRSVLATRSWPEAAAALAKGGKVLYYGGGKAAGAAQFKPVYWSSAHFRFANADMLTLGYAVDPAHPALRRFPTEDWSDWLWYHLVDGGRNFKLDGLPQNFKPIVTPVPDLHYSTFMGMLFELKCGEGKLLVCGCKIEDADKRPECAALRKCLLDYMESGDFAPQVEVSPKWLESRFSAK